MKTSNYIIIAFFIFLFGGVFVLFLTSKYHKEELPQWKADEKPLDNFSVIVAESGAKFQVFFGETPKMEIRYKLPDTLSYPKLYVRNDTLFMFPWEGKIQSKKFDKGIVIQYDNVNVYAKQIKSIIGKENSRVKLYKFSPDTLNIEANGSKIYCNFQKSANPKGLLNIKATGMAYVQVNDFNGKKLNPNLTQSELKLHNSTVQTLTGSMVKSSAFRSHRAIHTVNLETDSTSTYHLEKYIYITKPDASGKMVEYRTSNSYEKQTDYNPN